MRDIRERYDVLAIGAHRDDVDVFIGGAIAEQIRRYRPRFVFTSAGCGVPPDHKAGTDIVTNAVFYARLPKWDEVPGGDHLAETAPHEKERLQFGHYRREAPWQRFDGRRIMRPAVKGTKAALLLSDRESQHDFQPSLLRLAARFARCLVSPD